MQDSLLTRSESDAAHQQKRVAVLTQSPDRDVVQAHLTKIGASAEFARSEQMMRLLRHITECALDSRFDALKERLIGEQVFGRAADWDPRLDTIVRTEARRLRSKLESYYENIGKTDEIRIRLPKGGYIPQFEYFGPSPGLLLSSAQASSSSTSGISFPWRRWGPAIAALLLPVILSVVWIRYKNTENNEDSFQIVPFATELGQEYSPAISPDGKKIAYVWDGDSNNLDIYISSVDGKNRQRFTDDPASDLYPAWSPDGQSLAFLRTTGHDTSVVLKSIPNGLERIVTHVMTEVGRWSGDSSSLLGNPGPVWTPDGQHLIVTDRNEQGSSTGLHLISIGDGKRRQLTSTIGEVRDFYPHLSPDGHSLAFVRYFSHGIGEVFVTSFPDGKPTQRSFDKHTIRGITWTPDGKNLIFASNRSGSFQLWSMGAWRGVPKHIVSNTSSASDPVMPPNGDWVAYVESNENWNIWRAEITDAGMASPRRFLSSSGLNYDARPSPDGSQIAFASDRSGSWEVWICDQDGTNLRQLTHFSTPWVGGINWSPDSHKLAFDSRPNGHSGIFMISVDGGEPQAVEQNDYEERMPSWSADGKSLYFNSNRDGTISIWKRTLASGHTVKIASGDMFTAAESPDGKDLYFSNIKGEIWKAAPDGSNAVRLPDAVQASPVMSWVVSPYGLFFSHTNRDSQHFLLSVFVRGQVKTLGSPERPLALNTPALAVSSNGKWLFYSEQEQTGSDIKIRKRTSATY